jgi:hypothetical protein
MPALEYFLLADYVRQDGAFTHIMGAAIDTFMIPADRMPAAAQVGMVARLSFDSRDPVGADHTLDLVFYGPGDAELLTAHQIFQTPPPIPGIPGHWRPAMNVISRFILPLPAHGDYRLQVTIDDDPQISKSLDVRAIEPPHPG